MLILKICFEKIMNIKALIVIKNIMNDVGGRGGGVIREGVRRR